MLAQSCNACGYPIYEKNNVKECPYCVTQDQQITASKSGKKQQPNVKEVISSNSDQYFIKDFQNQPIPGAVLDKEEIALLKKEIIKKTFDSYNNTVLEHLQSKLNQSPK